MCLNVLLKVGSVTFYFVIFHFLLSIFYTTHCLPCLPLLGNFSGRFHSKVHKMCSDGQLVLSDFCVEMSDLSQIIWPKMTEFPISNVSGRCQGQSLRHRWLRPMNVSLTAVKQKAAWWLWLFHNERCLSWPLSKAQYPHIVWSRKGLPGSPTD